MTNNRIIGPEDYSRGKQDEREAVCMFATTFAEMQDEAVRGIIMYLIECISGGEHDL